MSDQFDTSSLFPDAQSVTKSKISIKNDDPQFSGKIPELALGYLTGTRAFDVDVLGRLRGVTLNHIWTPGVNYAECRKDDLNRLRAYNPFGSFSLWGNPYADTDVDFTKKDAWNAFVRACDGMKTPNGIDRAIAEYKTLEAEIKAQDSIVNCSHGFYGYYEGSNDYRSETRINGVIKAYGEVVIGTRGFRASKAEVIALHIPKTINESVAALIRRNYPDVVIFKKFKDMVAEFPPDKDAVPSPLTNPDFWTQEA